MLKKLNYLLFSILFLMFFIFGCKKNEDKIYVDFYFEKPSAILDEEGKPDSLYISFEGSVAKLDDVEKESSLFILTTKTSS